MSPMRSFKSYVGLDTTRTKLTKILSDFPVTTFASVLESVDDRGASSGAKESVTPARPASAAIESVPWPESRSTGIDGLGESLERI